MRFHISWIVSTCFFHLRRLRHLRRTLDRDVRQRLVSAFILSRIDYCNVVFATLPSVTLAPLRRVMSAAVRFVTGLGPRYHTSDAQRELHWLPIEQRITYKLCVIMHSVVIGTSPEYISDMVTPVSELSGRAHLRSAALGLYDVPRTRTVWVLKLSLSPVQQRGTVFHSHFLTFHQLPFLNVISRLSFLIVPINK